MKLYRRFAYWILFSLGVLSISGTSYGQQVNVSNVFSSFELQLDGISKKSGGNVDLAMKYLDQLKLVVKTNNEFAILGAFQCELFRARNEFHLIDAMNFSLMEKIKQDSSDHDLRTANELCLFLREAQQATQTPRIAMAYQYARFAKSPILRFLVSSMYMELTASQGRAQEAVDAAQMALTIAQANNDMFRQSIAMRGLAAIELDYGDKEAALDYIEQSIDLAENFPNRNFELLFRLNRASILISMKRLMEARVAVKQAEDLAEETNKGIPKELQDRSISIIILANAIELAYLEADYQSAIKNALKLEAEASKDNIPVLIASAQMSFALASMRLNNDAAMENQFKKAVQVFIDLKRPIEVRDGYEKLAEALAGIGRHKEAYLAMQKKDEYISSIAKESRSHRAEQIRETLKVNQREKEYIELKLLNTKQQAEVASTNLRLQRWWLFAALLALGLTWATQLVWMARKRNTSLQHLNKELDDQRLHDALTGLGNRRYLMQHQDALWNNTLTQAKHGKHSAILLVDADHFKHINDQYGHAAGDAALIDIAKRLKDCIRETDQCVRWGGEEFLIYIDSCDRERIESLSASILQSIRGTNLIYDNQEISLSVSIGYLTLPLGYDDQDPFNLEDSFKLVDATLYLAKHLGRNRALGLHQIHHHCRGKGLLIRELEDAWRSGEIELSVIEGTK
ncbi:diguanylate cyclase domain-containing protein [Undibacterium sp.]|uniref:tetratricopeptide repeat-containing diguanylate cyclase n=1 Tax=Undibacterium sp. TaxID=1914977 RepID=UPI003750BB7C